MGFETAPIFASLGQQCCDALISHGIAKDTAVSPDMHELGPCFAVCKHTVELYDQVLI